MISRFSLSDRIVRNLWARMCHKTLFLCTFWANGRRTTWEPYFYDSLLHIWSKIGRKSWKQVSDPYYRTAAQRDNFFPLFPLFPPFPATFFPLPHAIVPKPGLGKSWMQDTLGVKSRRRASQPCYIVSFRFRSSDAKKSSDSQYWLPQSSPMSAVSRRQHRSTVRDSGKSCSGGSA